VGSYILFLSPFVKQLTNVPEEFARPVCVRPSSSGWWELTGFFFCPSQSVFLYLALETFFPRL
jgi:hypothetical protein